MKVVSLYNEKGGVAKTSLSVHLAAGLAIRGYRVVLIDGDAQGNATGILGLAKEGALYDLIVRNASWRQCLRLIDPAVYATPNRDPDGQLFAVPSNVETRNIATTISDGTVFLRRFNELKSAVDFIIVDTSPTPSLLHASILAASNYILMPTQTEAFSAFEGLADSLIRGDIVRSAAAAQGIVAAQVLGIVPTLFRPKTVAHRDTLQYLKDTYGALVWPPISMSITYAEAALMRQLIYSYKPKSAAAKELWAIVDRVEKVGART